MQGGFQYFSHGRQGGFSCGLFRGGQAVIPESIIRGVQWFIYDRIEDEQTIKEALDHADKAMKEQERKEAEMKAKLQEKRLMLPQQYPHLTANRLSPTANWQLRTCARN